MGYKKFLGPGSSELVTRNSREKLSTFSPDFPVKDSWEFPRIFRKIVTWVNSRLKDSFGKFLAKNRLFYFRLNRQSEIFIDDRAYKFSIQSILQQNVSNLSKHMVFVPGTTTVYGPAVRIRPDRS